MKKQSSQGKTAVSPVIGVILMVAITVILATIIGTATLGFAGGVEENVRAGVSADTTSNGASEVSWIATGNADYLNVTVSGDAEFDDDGGIKEGPIRMNTTGSSVTILPDEGATGPINRVHVSASGDVAYYDATGGDIEINACDTGSANLCESSDGIITKSGASGFAQDVPEDADIRITVVAVKDNGESKTTVLSKEING